MLRAEIWVTFAMGAAGQFPTARLAASHADEMLAEYDQRFPDNHENTDITDTELAKIAEAQRTFDAEVAAFNQTKAPVSQPDANDATLDAATSLEEGR